MDQKLIGNILDCLNTPGPYGVAHGWDPQMGFVHEGKAYPKPCPQCLMVKELMNLMTPYGVR